MTAKNHLNHHFLIKTGNHRHHFSPPFLQFTMTLAFYFKKNCAKFAANFAKKYADFRYN